MLHVPLHLGFTCDFWHHVRVYSTKFTAGHIKHLATGKMEGTQQQTHKCEQWGDAEGGNDPRT